MIIIIKHKGNVELLHGEAKRPAYQYVEAWQREKAAMTLGGNLPPVSWKVAESENLIEAMIESAKVNL